jgi:hypothetical protein
VFQWSENNVSVKSTMKRTTSTYLYLLGLSLRLLAIDVIKSNHVPTRYAKEQPIIAVIKNSYGFMD